MLFVSGGFFAQYIYSLSRVAPFPQNVNTNFQFTVVYSKEYQESSSRASRLQRRGIAHTLCTFDFLLYDRIKPDCENWLNSEISRVNTFYINCFNMS